MDMGKQNDEGAKWALFQNNKTGYKVPNELIDVVGGGFVPKPLPFYP